MSAPLDPDELALVKKAILCGATTGLCFEWQEQALRVYNREQLQLCKWTPAEIRKQVIEHLHSNQVEITQHKEEREGHRDRHEFWYEVIIPVAHLTHGLFVEVILTDRDTDYPEARIVRAKPSTTA